MNIFCRFKEREENVKADIFHAYTALLKQTKPTTTSINTSSQEMSMDAEDVTISLLHTQGYTYIEIQNTIVLIWSRKNGIVLLQQNKIKLSFFFLFI